jgi:hypothetical protein
MKKYISLLIILLTIYLISPLSIFADGGHDITLEGVLTNIMESQNITDDSEIDCDKVVGGQFEDLGEAVMSLMHPNEQEHEFMDQMMGGEGSESLKQAHIVIGQRYLGCDAEEVNSNMMGGMNMMSSGGMMSGGFNSMMPGFGSFGLFTALGVVLIIFFILGSAVFLKFLFVKTPTKS